MKRIIVLKRESWEHRHLTDRYQVLEDITDRELQKRLKEMNKPYYSNLWEVVEDYDLSKRKDIYAYAEYCVSCAANRYHRDADSRAKGEAMVKALMEQVQ